MMLEDFERPQSVIEEQKSAEKHYIQIVGSIDV